MDTVSSINLVFCVTQRISLHDCLAITSPHWNRLGFTTKNLSQKHTSHWLCQALTQFSVQKRSILPNSSFSETSSQALQLLQRTKIRKTKQSKEILPDRLWEELLLSQSKLGKSHEARVLESRDRHEEVSCKIKECYRAGLAFPKDLLNLFLRGQSLFIVCLFFFSLHR